MYGESVRMPFGKHRGLYISELPDSYIDWLRSLGDLRGLLQDAVEHEWRRRHEAYQRRHAPPPEPEPTYQPGPKDKELYAELVQAGYRSLARKYHPDHGGDPEAMKRLNALVKRLRDGLAG